MRILFLISVFLTAISAQAGNFFPPEYKQFAFQAGDLLVSKRSDGKFAVNKILKVDRFDFQKNSSIDIQGKNFIVTEDDYLLVVSTAFGAAEFTSFEQARAAALSGKWPVAVDHAPNRTPGAAAGQTLVGHASVKETELTGYQLWYRAFKNGSAGVF
jgi:hypothetical protein